MVVLDIEFLLGSVFSGTFPGLRVPLRHPNKVRRGMRRGRKLQAQLVSRKGELVYIGKPIRSYLVEPAISPVPRPKPVLTLVSWRSHQVDKPTRA